MVSLLIRNKNEGKALENALISVRRQVVNFPVEIVLVDDHSTDESLSIASKYGCKIFHLDRPFTYGYALNFGVSKCSNEIIVLMSSHNILLSTDILSRLVDFFANKNVAAVRFTPIHNTTQIVNSLKGIKEITDVNFNQKQNWGDLLIANCSAIRKSVAVSIPFEENIRSNEDKLWSLQVIQRGHSIISNSGCYYIYNHGHKSSSIVRDKISKFQIDGEIPLSNKDFLIFLIKFPLKSIFDFITGFINKMSTEFKVYIIPFRFKKGDYS